MHFSTQELSLMIRLALYYPRLCVVSAGSHSLRILWVIRSVWLALLVSGVSVSALSTSNGAGKWLGCYTDSNARPCGSTPSGSGYTQETCSAYAQQKNLRYYCLEWKGQCFSTDANPTTLGTSTKCTTACSAAPSEACGGSWAIDVWDLASCTTSEYMYLDNGYPYCNPCGTGAISGGIPPLGAISSTCSCDTANGYVFGAWSISGGVVTNTCSLPDCSTLEYYDSSTFSCKACGTAAISGGGTSPTCFCNISAGYTLGNWTISSGGTVNNTCTLKLCNATSYVNPLTYDCVWCGLGANSTGGRPLSCSCNAGDFYTQGSWAIGDNTCAQVQCDTSAFYCQAQDVCVACGNGAQSSGGRSTSCSCDLTNGYLLGSWSYNSSNGESNSTCSTFPQVSMTATCRGSSSPRLSFGYNVTGTQSITSDTSIYLGVDLCSSMNITRVAVYPRADVVSRNFDVTSIYLASDLKSYVPAAVDLASTPLFGIYTLSTVYLPQQQLIYIQQVLQRQYRYVIFQADKPELQVGEFYIFAM